MLKPNVANHTTNVYSSNAGIAYKIVEHLKEVLKNE